MIYRDFQGKQLSLLGFGTMRLPQTDPKDASSVNEKATSELFDLALRSGVNYFDTASPYHNGESERVVGRILSQYPRESYFLADKYPGHQIFREYDPKALFENQLKKCRVDYFDFYLFHNVFENSIHTYNDPRWGITDYFIEQKKNGRVRHLGFSTHGGLEIMEEFIRRYGEHLEFCQIQLNYLDWSLQDARAKVELLNRYKIPIWVMEPVRGGKLAKLHGAQEAVLSEMRPDHSPAAWAFRFLQDFPEVKMILSGMSTLDQLKDNLSTFEKEAPLTEKERKTLFDIAEQIKESVPCTACSYCTASCPKGLDIPLFLSIYNEIRVAPSFNASMRLEFLPEDKKPSACIACGKCRKMCPQSINIPEVLRDLEKLIQKIPSWRSISKEREKQVEQETGGKS